jgi:ankyrin repeat protein
MFTEGDVRSSLQTLPETLTGAYNDIYHSITSQKGSAPRLALNAFHWIQCSYEPLRTETLLDAITLEVGRSGEFSRKARINANDLLRICQNLLILDESLNVFRFAHLSVQEYLESQPQLRKADSHAEIAKGCFSLLCTPGSWGDYEEVRIEEGGYRDHHLLSYSVLFWPWHLSHCADVNGCQTLTDLWNAFVSESNYQQWLNYHRKWVKPSIWTIRDTFWRRVDYWQKGADNILLLVCVLGLSMMFTAVFESTGHDLKSDLGSFILISSDLGDLNITALLIDNGADVSATDKHGQTPLHLASWQGHEGVAQLLIDRGADFSATDQYGHTPLHVASWTGREGVARLLIDRGADFSATEKYGRTPLHLASRWGHEGVARLLIDRGADVWATDKDGQTALHLASWDGHEGVARLLIDRGADIWATDKDAQTPLDLASLVGHEEVARLLIDRGAGDREQEESESELESEAEAEKSDGQACGFQAMF